MDENSDDKAIARLKEYYRKMFGERLIDITVTAYDKFFRVCMHLKD